MSNAANPAIETIRQAVAGIRGTTVDTRPNGDIRVYSQSLRASREAFAQVHQALKGTGWMYRKGRGGAVHHLHEAHNTTLGYFFLVVA